MNETEPQSTESLIFERIRLGYSLQDALFKGVQSNLRSQDGLHTQINGEYYQLPLIYPNFSGIGNPRELTVALKEIIGSVDFGVIPRQPIRKAILPYNRSGFESSDLASFLSSRNHLNVRLHRQSKSFPNKTLLQFPALDSIIIFTPFLDIRFFIPIEPEIVLISNRLPSSDPDSLRDFFSVTSQSPHQRVRLPTRSWSIFMGLFSASHNGLYRSRIDSKPEVAQARVSELRRKLREAGIALEIGTSREPPSYFLSPEPCYDGFSPSRGTIFLKLPFQ